MKSPVWLLLLLVVALAGCGEIWNQPYPKAQEGQKVLYSSFADRPKYLDPARSYSTDESRFIDQIYEPPLAYHYLKRPFTLIPNTLTAMPEIRYSNQEGKEVAANAPDLAYSTYYFAIKPGIRYQPHPAFAKNTQGEPLYRWHSAEGAKNYRNLADFKNLDSKELTAEDYLYQIRRLADPKNLSPVKGLLGQYLVGMNEFGAQAKKAREALEKMQGKGAWLDLRTLPFAGIEELGRYEFSIRLKGQYPQFKYWLAFHFFAPLPALVDEFYAQPGLLERNISLNWYPVGTGAFMLTKNNPNEAMIMEKNPNYHEDFYPSEGESTDEQNGLLKDAGKRLPLIDKAVYRLEQEAIPLWTKFLQGYYDRSGIGNDSFDNAIRVSGEGVELSDDMNARGIRLEKEILLGTYYMGFNMLDPVLGDTGSSVEREQKRKLRQAIQIAYDQQEMISIFSNGRGEVGMSPIPPGIFGHQAGEAGLNASAFIWENGTAVKKSIEEAKALLAQAGYPDGRDAKTGKPLVLNLDTTAGGNTAIQNWMIKQFKKINIQLNIRSTDYNRFQEKLSTGNAQIFQWGWMADYPDAENFLFLLYGANGQVKAGGSGVNASNFENKEYDALFDKMQLMEDSPERAAIIAKMVKIVQEQAPWIAIWHPYSYILNNQWVSNTKPHGISKSLLKYYAIDPIVREQKQQEWNKPVLWPMWLLLSLLATALFLSAWLLYRHQQAVVFKE